jgi:hypothetical protein
MVGSDACQRIKINVFAAYMRGGFLASGLQVFGIVSRRRGMAVWQKGMGFFR